VGHKTTKQSYRLYIQTALHVTHVCPNLQQILAGSHGRKQGRKLFEIFIAFRARQGAPRGALASAGRALGQRRLLLLDSGPAILLNKKET